MAKKSTTRTWVEVGLVAFAALVVYEIFKSLNKPAGATSLPLSGGGGGGDSYAPFSPTQPRTPNFPSVGAGFGGGNNNGPNPGQGANTNPLSAYLAGNSIPTNYDNGTDQDFIPTQPLLNAPDSDLLSISAGSSFASLLPGGGGYSQNDANLVGGLVGQADVNNASPSNVQSVLATFDNPYQAADDAVNASDVNSASPGLLASVLSLFTSPADAIAGSLTANDTSAYSDIGIPTALDYSTGYDPTSDDNGSGLGSYDNPSGEGSSSTGDGGGDDGGGDGGGSDDGGGGGGDGDPDSGNSPSGDGGGAEDDE